MHSTAIVSLYSESKAQFILFLGKRANFWAFVSPSVFQPVPLLLRQLPGEIIQASQGGLYCLFLRGKLGTDLAYMSRMTPSSELFVGFMFSTYLAIVSLFFHSVTLSPSPVRRRSFFVLWYSQRSRLSIVVLR